MSQVNEIDAESSPGVVDMLRSDIDALNGMTAGAVGHFRATRDDGDPRGLVTRDALGLYPASADAAKKYKEHYETVAATYDVFIASYEEFITGLEARVGLRGRVSESDAKTVAAEPHFPPSPHVDGAEALVERDSVDTAGSGLTYTEIILGMQPDVVASVADAYVAVRDRIKASTGLIDDQTGRLAPGAVDGNGETLLRRMRDAAERIQRICDAVGRTLYQHAVMQRKYRRDLYENENFSTTAAVDMVLAAAENEIRDFQQNTVELADGATSTAGQVRRDLSNAFEAIRHTVMQLRALHHQGGSMHPEEYQPLLEELAVRQNSGAQKVDELTTVLRDAVDASAAARGVCEARMRLNESDARFDAADSMRISQQASETLEREKRDWHELVDKLAGGLYRIPDTVAEADGVIAAMHEFANVISDRIAAEQGSNQTVTAELEKMRRQVESTQQIHRVDPRTSADRPTDIRDVLREMYGDEEGFRTDLRR